MEPIVAPFMTNISFALRDLVGVVGEDIVHTAAVDIEIFTEIFHADTGALDVPAGVAHAPGGIPLQSLILELALGEPQDEVVLVALVGVLLHALPDTGGQILLVVVIENIVLLQGGGVEVNIIS